MKRGYCTQTLIGAAALLAPSLARADPQSLAPNFPIQIEDALVVPTGVFQVQADDHFSRASAGVESGTAEPVFKIGAAPHLQLDVSPSYNWASRNSPANGAFTVDALYQLNDNSKYIPAFAVHAYVQTGYGPNPASTSFIVRGIATKYLGDSTSAPRLHLNVTWTDVTAPAVGQRPSVYAFAAGYSRLLTAKLALVTDLVDEEQPLKTRWETLADAGLVYQFSRDWSVSVGGGGGVAGHAADQRFFLAVERNVSLF